jgi:hypothetical protein
MGLSADLVSQFAKITNGQTNEKKESTVYGQIVEHGGKNYVQLDGSELLTPIITTVEAKPGDRVTVLLKNHTATVTGNITSPAVRTETVNVVVKDIENVNEVLADVVTADSLNALNAKISNLETANATITESLNANSASISDLEAADVTINNTLTANKASITQLQAADATINGRLDANEADIDDLKANTIDADTIRATYATIENLNATNANVSNLTADVADIDTLIFGSASGDVIQTSFSNAVIAQLGDAQIKSAMIDSISAGKITSGDIITNNVRVLSEDGSLIISDETMQISDGTRVRVQIGKDTANDYSINVWDQNGELMFSKGGITDKAIKDAIIRNDMVSDTANIAAHKLDIDSLFEEINGSENTIKSTKVYLDDEGQTLDVAFESLSSTVTEQSETITSQGTAISTIQGQISSKIWQQDINTASGEMSTQYSALSQEIDSVSATVASHTTQIGTKADSSTVTAVSNKVTNLESDLSGFQTTVSDTYATKDEVSDIETRVTSAETKISQNEAAIALRATKTEVSTAKSEAISEAASDATSKANDALSEAKSYADAQIKVSADGITSTVNSVKTTADTALSTANGAKKQRYHTADGTAGTAGYVGIAQLVVTGNYVNSPILFSLSNRGQQSSNVSLCFKSVNNTDPGLQHIQNDGGMKIWAYKADTSTWQIVVQKSEAWDEIYVNDFANPRGGVTVTWIDILYTELPTENITESTVLAGKIEKSTIDNLGTRMTTAESSITQLSDRITTNVTATNNLGTRMSTVEQTAIGLEARLDTDETDIDTAQSTANTAKTNAATAQTTANNAAKTATNYLGFSSSGLVVGDMTASTLGKNVLIDSDSVDIRNGTTTLASFAASKVILGRNAEDSEIDLCDGAGRISANTASASTSYPHRNAILIDSQEIETESLRFVASTSNGYGASSTPTVQRGTELYMLRSSGSAESCARLKAEHKTTSSGAYTNSGVSAITYDSASSTRLLAFASDSANSTYNQVNIYPTKTTMNKPLVLNGVTHTGKNKVLWSGGYYMSDTQTATLSEAISAQPNGVVLLWSYYVDGASDNSNFRPYFIPKQFVASHPGKGISMFMTNGTMSIAASKYVYISDTSIKGHSNNSSAAADKTCGITSTPKNFVLRYVIGV